MLKPTLRRNGKHEITVRTTHHLDVDGAARILAHNAAYLGLHRDGDLTRAAAEELIREELCISGLEHTDTMWADGLDDDVLVAARNWARQQIGHLFPAMLPDLSGDF